MKKNGKFYESCAAAIGETSMKSTEYIGA